MSFALPVVPRYAEVDQQGVVFFGHYLTWCDEALSAYQTAVGYPYADMIADGVDIQVVHAELDYGAPVRWGDLVAVGVENEKIGTTSLTTRFTIRRRTTDDEPWCDAVTARLVHVCVDTDGWAKTPVPRRLVDAVGAAHES